MPTRSRITKTSVNPIWVTRERGHGAFHQSNPGRHRHRRDLCLHGARRRHDLPGDRPPQFRARRNGDVLDLHRLATDPVGAALLARLHPRRRRIVRRRCVDRARLVPIHNAPVLSNIVAFIALYSILNGAAGFIWDFNIKTFPSPFGSKSLFDAGLIGAHEAGMIGVTLILLGLLYLFFRGTRLGLAMRAAAANPESARLVGIRVGWMTALGWGMAASIGAV